MKLFCIVAIFITAFATIASAAPTEKKYFVTLPKQNSAYRAGAVLETKWRNTVSDGFSLHLLFGDDPSTMQDTRLSFDTDPSKKSYKWSIPSDFPTGTYAFRFVYLGGDNYSPQFQIVSGSPPVETVTSGGSGNQ